MDMGSVPGLRYQPNSVYYFKYHPQAPGGRPFYLPEIGGVVPRQYERRYRRSDGLMRQEDTVYQDQVAVMDLMEDDVDEKDNDATHEVLEKFLDIGNRNEEHSETDQEHPDMSLEPVKMPVNFLDKETVQRKETEKDDVATRLSDPGAEGNEPPADTTSVYDKHNEVTLQLKSREVKADDDIPTGKAVMFQQDVPQDEETNREKHSLKEIQEEAAKTPEEQTTNLDATNIGSTPQAIVSLQSPTDGNTGIRRRGSRSPVSVGSAQYGVYLSGMKMASTNPDTVDGNAEKADTDVQVFAAGNEEDNALETAMEEEEKSAAHSRPTLTFHHSPGSEGVHLQVGVPQPDNTPDDHLNPDAALSDQRTSPDLAQQLSHSLEHSLRRLQDPEQELEHHTASKEEPEDYEGMHEVYTHREKTITEDMEEIHEENESVKNDAEDVREYYHGSRTGFQDTILTNQPPLPRIPNSHYSDPDGLTTTASYLYGKVFAKKDANILGVPRNVWSECRCEVWNLVL